MSDPFGWLPPAPGSNRAAPEAWHAGWRPPPPPPARSPAATVALATVASIAGLVVMIATAVGGFMAAPFLAIAVPAGAVMAAVCRPRRPGDHGRSRPAPAPRRNPTRKTSPSLMKYPTKKG